MNDKKSQEQYKSVRELREKAFGRGPNESPVSQLPYEDPDRVGMLIAQRLLAKVDDYLKRSNDIDA